jgi:hypothetical protein
MQRFYENDITSNFGNDNPKIRTPRWIFGCGCVSQSPLPWVHVPFFFRLTQFVWNMYISAHTARISGANPPANLTHVVPKRGCAIYWKNGVVNQIIPPAKSATSITNAIGKIQDTRHSLHAVFFGQGTTASPSQKSGRNLLATILPLTQKCNI